ncbi:class I SAM-dependent methyltransferase [Fundidesulfovibrio terrae]|uniref:class I SAM-dependent methyltransferase n=1 Tax=Fundidesulfovibrio terrae TaxID=2922866 RepID=UPI001FAF9798|nr:class I SAM-dependent methyltransferase [Fundidesulfovibrio terrae]
MFVNWPERFFCNSFVRRFIQRGQAQMWRGMRKMAPGGDALEIGCGNGAGAQLILEYFKPRKLTALDPDPAMLRLARKRLAGPVADGVAEVIEGDAQNLPCESASLDAVFNFGIVHHLEDWRRGIAEVARVLKPGGAFYIEEIFQGLYANAFLRHVVAHPEHDRFQAPQFKAALADKGLVLLPGHHESHMTMLGVAVKREDP